MEFYRFLQLQLLTNSFIDIPNNALQVCKGHFLSGDHYPAKSTLKRKSEITSVAGGAGIRHGMRR
jgi:hypothetical protein